MTTPVTAARRGLLGAFATFALGRDGCDSDGWRAAASGFPHVANNVLTAAGMQGRGRFVAHPQEFQELRVIAGPLIEMQHGCGAAIPPMQIAALYRRCPERAHRRKPRRCWRDPATRDAGWLYVD